MKHQLSSPFRRRALFAAIVGALAAQPAYSDLSGPVLGGNVCDPVPYGEDVTIVGDIVGGSVDAEGLTNSGLLLSIGGRERKWRD